jgi:hypothetical protein
LWTAQAAKSLGYSATGLLDAGISGAPPRLADGGIDRDSTEPLASSSGAAVFWVQLYGLQAGDVEELRFMSPDGRLLAERQTTVPRNLAQSFAYVGARRRAPVWPPGNYRGEYSLYRGEGKHKLLSFTREIPLRAE